jgi:hypothetical protein
MTGAGLERPMAARHPDLPHSRKLTIVAQDPSVKLRGKIVTAQIDVPAEELLPGPRGYRVNVIDFDASTGHLYKPAIITAMEDPFDRSSKARRKISDQTLLEDPRFHAQNAYAIVMRTLARFEFALGRRVAWGCDGHQLHIAPHAFAEANAFYSRDDRGLFFGYFDGEDGKPVFTALSHDVVAHEATHAILDGLRARYLEPSSPDQAAFHEGFSDVVALLSVFSLKDIVAALLDRKAGAGKLISNDALKRDELTRTVLFGLADEMGEELSQVRGEALRRSVELKPGKDYMSTPEFQEEHTRGELLVAAVMNAFLDIWLERLKKVGFIEQGKRDRSIVVEEGARVADHLLTMAIRAVDYCPPTDLQFGDYLAALLTVDREVVPDDQKYGYRNSLLKNFAAYGIKPPAGTAADQGTWPRFRQPLHYGRVRFESMLRDKEEVFRFLWENRTTLGLDDRAYTEVQSVRPSSRIGPDGFILRETVSEYVQILTLEAGELKAALKIDPPEGLPKWRRVRLYGGGTLIFDEYGQVKFHVSNPFADIKRQQDRLSYLFAAGFFDQPPDPKSHFASLHLKRAQA